MLHLLLGRAGSGKTTQCLQEIERELRRENDGPALLYLVPEQAAFQAEYTLATRPGLGGTMRAQALSFRRLAWKVLQETGGGRRLFIDDTGKGMVLRKILEKHKKCLKIFRHAAETPGLIDALVRLYNEMRRANTSVFQLREYLDRQAQEPDREGLLRGKLQEVALIFEEAEHELSAHYVDAEDYLLLLAMQLPQSSLTRGALLWVDGFYGFTELEFLVLKSLLGHIEKMTVTLCLTRDYPPQEIIDELDPFHASAQTCQQLQRLAAECKKDVEKIVLSAGNGTAPYRFQNSPPLAHLERHLHAYPAVPYINGDEPLPLRLTAAANRRAEAEGVAREIIALARDHNYRFRDIAVLTHNLEDYSDLLIPVFKSYGIPFFLDQKRTILHHPLVEFIRSALEVVNGNWRTDAVFRCIKSSFLFPLEADAAQRRYWRDQASRLENYVLAFGIKGAAWQSENPWQYIYRDTFEEEDPKSLSQADSLFLEDIDRAKRRLSAPLLSFQEQFKASSRARNRVLALYNLLQSVSAEKQLELAAKQALAEGDPDKSREQEQVCQGIISLLEQLTEIIGEEDISAVFFARLIDAGLSALRLGMAPPSLDQVIVGNLERTRIGNLRALFLLGVNDGVLPARPGGESIFTEAELEIMEKQKFHLSSGPRRRLLDEEFLIYLSLTRAREMLWISYALADAEGKALLPSLLVSRLQELFPALAEQRQTDDSLLPFISHPRQTLSYLFVQLGRWKRGESLHPLWWEVYNWYAGGGWEREEAKCLLGGLFYRNTEHPLAILTSRELYGQTLQAGATRLERFCGCPFAHFAAYGLRLQQRLLYGLEAPDTGRFFHAALHNVARSLQKQQTHWSDWDKDKLLQCVSTEVTELLPRLQKEIMLSSRRYQHLAKKMEETVGRAALILAEHDRRSEFKPYALELAFADKSILPPLCLQLPDGSTVDVVGRIDRLDLARTVDDRLYLRIIDYKSGSTDLDLVEFYHGLSQQLILYLEAVLTHSWVWLKEDVLPAGVFYFRVHDPLISSSGPMTPQTLQTEMLKRFKLTGILLADPAVVRLMDKELQSGYSPVVPAAINKKGELYGTAKSLLTAADFAALCRHVRTIASDAATGILQGRLEISPYHLGHKKACTYCLYKAVCQFDLLLEENRYRRLTKVPEKL